MREPCNSLIDSLFVDAANLTDEMKILFGSKIIYQKTIVEISPDFLFPGFAAGYICAVYLHGAAVRLD